MMYKKKPGNKEIESTGKWDTWEKEPSEFPWSYDQKETCYILEGQATVSDNEGNEMSFGKGDWVVFEEGLECIWKISRKIKKRNRRLSKAHR